LTISFWGDKFIHHIDYQHKVTPPKINMEPEKKFSRKGSSSWKPSFSGSMLNFGGVMIGFPKLANHVVFGSGVKLSLKNILVRWIFFPKRHPFCAENHGNLLPGKLTNIF